MKQFGIKMPNKARSQVHRLRVCPVCRLPKYRQEFRESNRQPALNTICWQCRHDDPRCVAKQLYGVNFRRYDSMFRKKFFALNKLQKAKLSKKEVKRLSITKQIEQQSAKLLRFPERVAAIISKTYSIRGDDPKVIPDDEAIMRIRDLLDGLDDTVIERNKNKRLSR